MALKFSYQARNSSGKVITGIISSENESKARATLRRRNLFITQIRPVDSSKALKGKVTALDLAVFCRQFATMVQAGVPLLGTIRILAQQSDNKVLRGICDEMGQSLETGKTLSEAMRNYPKVFPPLFISMVEAGEVGGALETVLERLAGHFEKDADVRAKVKGALTYPAVVVVIAIIAVVILLTFVLPTIISMLVEQKVELPLPTRIVIWTSEFLQGYWYVLLAAVIASSFSLKKYAATAGGKALIDRAVLKLPVFGQLITKMIVSRFTRSLGTLLKSGVPLLQALDIVKSIAGNDVMVKAVAEAQQSIKEGQGLAQPLEKTGVFPPMVTKMISIGEDTGSLDSLLEKVAVFYDREVDVAVSKLSSSLEPLLMVFMGVVVGFIVISIFLPMFKVAGGGS